MKKSIAMLLFATAALTACGKANTTEQLPEASQQGAAAQPAAEEAEWPKEQITLYVPSKEGGNTDLQARLFAAGLEEVTGGTITVINQADGNGVPCLNSVAEAEADGYTLCLVSTRDLFKLYIQNTDGVNFDRNSFKNVSMIGESYVALFADEERFPSFEDLEAACEADPGTITIAVTNQASEVSMDLLTDTAATILYNSGSDAFTDVLGGHVDAAMVSLSFAPQGEEYGVKPILLFANTKLETFPELPTLADYEAEIAYSPMCRMLIAPAGISDTVYEQMVEACKKVFSDTDYAQRLIDMYDVPFDLTGDELESYITDNIAYLDEYVW